MCVCIINGYFRLFNIDMSLLLQVLYETAKFLEKNRDPLHSEIIELLSSCTGQLPQSFAALHKQSQSLDSTSVQSGMSVCKKQSVVTKFKVCGLFFPNLPTISSPSWGHTLPQYLKIGIKLQKTELILLKQDSVLLIKFMDFFYTRFSKIVLVRYKNLTNT